MPVLVALLLLVLACACATGGVWLLFGLGWALLAVAPWLLFLAFVILRGAHG